MDVSDVVDYNQALLNPNNLENSFFQLNPNDPTNGFPFDATRISGHCYPSLSDSSTALQAYPLAPGASNGDPPDLYVRLILGSHFASHLRLNCMCILFLDYCFLFFLNQRVLIIQCLIPAFAKNSPIILNPLLSQVVLTQLFSSGGAKRLY